MSAHPFVESSFMKARYHLCEAKIAKLKARLARRWVAILTSRGATEAAKTKERTAAVFWGGMVEKHVDTASHYRAEAKALRRELASLAKAPTDPPPSGMALVAGE